MAELTGDGASILAVIVLFQLRPEDSTAYHTLKAAISRLETRPGAVTILLYDNTPNGLAPQNLPPDVLYVPGERNEGVAGAYNYALRWATRKHFVWMLTLDQDTQLPPEFLLRMRAIALRLKDVNEAGAIVPHLLSRGRLLSPIRIRPWGVTYLHRHTAGFAGGEIHAFNSGSMFRLRALEQIDGCHPGFWLDYQDAYIYTKLHQCGRKIYIADNLEVEHDLSLLSPSRPMGEERLRNFLEAESAYCDLYRGRIGGLFLTGRLLGRIWRQRRHEADATARRLTRNQFLRRIFATRRTRLNAWRSGIGPRHLPAAEDGSRQQRREERPAISVCVAAYNGERYITAQLQSILTQLAANDEVIVVDDASTDGTKDQVLSLEDSRIRLIEHETNRGAARTFEDAIQAASGRILFLSDQDDLWSPKKVAVMLEAFLSQPNVTLIATDVSLIDSDGSLLAESYFKPRGKFRPGLWANVVRNRFGGCTLAFRCEIIGDILPLPRKYDVLHDVWIGVRNSLAGHQTLYIPEALVLNRRHGTTVTGKKTLTLKRRIHVRADLLLAQAEFWIRGLASWIPAQGWPRADVDR
jgi:glycosyltransferase involved in cell wall biosynthesis